MPFTDVSMPGTGSIAGRVSWRAVMGVALLAFPLRGAQVVSVKASAFDLADVRLLDGPFRRAEELERTYLLSLDADRFLYHFRVNAGLPTTAQPYGGWEAADWDFPGHMLGHYLSACAAMAAHGGEPEFQRRIDYMVAELAKCQQALARRASHPGFLDPQPESVFERLERGEAAVGVPLYTLHKTLAGLIDAHVLAHNGQALEVANGIAAWLGARFARLDDRQLQQVLRIEHGGLNEALANLSALTGDAAQLRLAERCNHEALFGPFARGEDPLGPGPGPQESRLIHANTQVPKAIGAAREYELTGKTAYRDVALNFWRTVARERSFIIGGNSETEHFFPRGREAHELTARTAEGCNTYNMLKLTRHLFAWAPSAELMDFYERALYNHMLAAQNPETGMSTYFMSLEPGGRKRFGTPEHTFWCCTGTAMETHVSHEAAIYAHDAEALYVNLFIASQVRWTARQLEVQQLTQFPEADTTELIVHTPRAQRFAVKVRWPYWAETMAVAVNGENRTVIRGPDSYVEVARDWRDGDRVRVRLPMTVRSLPLSDDPTLVAFMYGPLVLAGRLNADAVPYFPSGYVDNGKDPRGPRVAEEPTFVPGLVGDGDLARYLRREPAAPLTFATVGLAHPNDVTLVPLYRIVDEPYTVYWRRYDEGSWERAWVESEPKRSVRNQQLRQMTDIVWCGLPKSETAHAVESRGAPVVSSRLSLFRDATDGSVAWRLRTKLGLASAVRLGFLGGETAAFDVVVNGEVIAKVRPTIPAPAKPNRANVTTVQTYPLTASIVGEREVAEMRIVGHPEAGPARIVFCATTTP